MQVTLDDPIARLKAQMELTRVVERLQLLEREFFGEALSSGCRSPDAEHLALVVASKRRCSAAVSEAEREALAIRAVFAADILRLQSRIRSLQKKLGTGDASHKKAKSDVLEVLNLRTRARTRSR